MLQWIEGGSGSGKSYWIREKIASLASRGEKVLLIVPEQYSFETEREYYGLLGCRQMETVTVASFLKLSELIFREYGGLAGEYASDTAKRAIMRLAMKACRDDLRLYRKNISHPDFVDQMVRLQEELANSGVFPGQLEEAALKTEKSSLKDKLFDLELLFESYRSLLNRRYLDPSDRLGRALELARGKGFFQGTYIFLDEFKSFTALQQSFLRLMLREGSGVFVSLCMEREEEGSLLFSGVLDTRRRLLSLAAREEEKVLPPVKRKGNRRACDPALSHFISQIFRYQKEAFTGENRGVSCAAFYNEFDEAEYAAAKIRHLLMEKGFRFSDVAVIVRDMERYGPILEAAFDKYQVPYFKDGAESVDTMPVIRFAARLLSLLSGRIDRETLLAALKCGLLPFSDQEIADFESYGYVWQVQGEGFSHAFSQHPGGFTDRPLTDRDLSLLENAEKVRDYLWGFISRLRRRVEEASSISRGLYAHLTEEGIADLQQQRVASLEEEGQYSRAEDEKRSWDCLMELLDTLEGVVSLQEKEPAVTSSAIREYRELFALCARGYLLTERPQTIDCVLMGSAERVRVKGKKAVFLLGLNDGEFPLLPGEGGIFSDRDRLELIKNGLELSSTFERQLADERFVAYLAAAIPSEKLFLSYPMGDLTGREKQPSSLIGDFKSVFPLTPILLQKDIPPSFYCLSLSTAFLRYAKEQQNHRQADFLQSAQQVLQDSPLTKNRLEKLREKGERERFSLKDKGLAEALFTHRKPLSGLVLAAKGEEKRYRIVKKELSVRKGELTFSPSQIERYYSCGFQYFCRYGLGLSPQRKAELDPLSRGNVIHEFLRFALMGKGGKLSQAPQQLADDFLQDYLQRAMGGELDKTGRFLYFYRRLRDTLANLLTVLRKELSQSEFQVSGVEEAIRKGGVIAPFCAKTADGRQVSVAGKIDRVDRFFSEEDGRSYVRIIDYKSGGKNFDISAAAAGLNLQMLLYLFAISGMEEGKYAGAYPAGILYMPAGNPRPALERGAETAQEEDAFFAAYRMNGLLLNDGRVLTAMEKDMAGKFIPISQGRNGYKGKYLSSLAELSLLRKQAEKLVGGMADALLAGRISPSPKKQSASGSAPCDYCDYKGLCGHEEADGVEIIEKCSYEEFIQQLKGDSEDA